MSKQLIFLVETNRSCKSDWMYIKSTLDYYYDVRSDIHYEVIYLNDENIESKKKKDKSEMFMRKNMIRNVPNEKLNCDKLIPGRSNILAVMDKYFEK